MSAFISPIPEHRNSGAPDTPLFGREADVRAICDLLAEDDVRLVTVTGPGGVGKTRIAHAVLETATDGDQEVGLFVPLETEREADRIIPAIAAALGVTQFGGAPLEDLVGQAIARRHRLLVLDNLEQFGGTAAQVVRSLLEAAPGVTLLVTSRMPLQLRAEQQYPLAPLSFTERAASPAVQLFVERARSVRPGFTLDDTTQADVIAICERLDGLPLAIELAARRSRLLSPAALLARLTNRLNVLEGGSRDLPNRQRTIVDTVRWSVDLLSPEHQRLFRRLAIFPAAFSLEDAGVLVGAAAPLDDAIGTLLDHSLLMEVSGPDGERWLRMLMPIRDVGLEMLASAAELAEAEGAFVGLVTTWATAILAAKRSPGGKSRSQGLAEGRFAHGIAAIDLALRAGQNGDAALIVAALYTFIARKRSASEGLALVGRVIGKIDDLSPQVQAMLLDGQAHFTYSLARFDDALTASNGAIAAWERVGDAPLELGTAFNQRANVHYLSGRLQDASADYERGLEILSPLGNSPALGTIVGNLGNIAYMAGEFDRAERYYSRALSIQRALGNTAGMAHTLHDLTMLSLTAGAPERALEYGREMQALLSDESDPKQRSTTLFAMGVVRMHLGELDLAEQQFRQLLALHEERNERHFSAVAQMELGNVAFRRDRFDDALSWFRAALSNLSQTDPVRETFEVIAAFGACAERLDQPDVAATLYGWADRIAREMGFALWEETEPKHDELRRRLGDRVFRQRWEDGRQLSLGEAIALTETIRLAGAAEASHAPVPTPREPVAPAHDLTARELEVLRLIAEGKSNAGIGDALFISPLTAKTHVANLLGKLGVETRAAAAAWAVQQGVI